MSNEFSSGNPDFDVPCVDCGTPVGLRCQGSYWETYGWAEYRGSKVGGTNNLKWNRTTGKALCPKCAFDRKTKAKGQRSLF